MASAVRNRVFRTTVSTQAAQMDPSQRTVLADQMAQDMQNEQGAGGVQETLRQIESELKNAQTMLKTSQDRELFLGQRSRQYRKALDARAEQLRRERKQLEGSADEETAEASDLELRMERWEKDEDALQQIVATHKDILVHCETIRRKIRELQVKQKDIVGKTQECQEFLAAAAYAEDAELAGLEAAAQEEEEAALEMSRLVASGDEIPQETGVAAENVDELDETLVTAVDAEESKLEEIVS